MSGLHVLLQMTSGKAVKLLLAAGRVWAWCPEEVNVFRPLVVFALGRAAT